MLMLFYVPRYLIGSSSKFIMLSPVSILFMHLYFSFSEGFFFLNPLLIQSMLKVRKLSPYLIAVELKIICFLNCKCDWLQER